MFTRKPALQGADRLSLLYRISQTFNSTLELDQVLNLVMDEIIQATQAERGFLMLANSSGELKFQAARGLDQHDIHAPELQISHGLVERVFREGQPLVTSNAQDDDWLSERRSVMVLGLRSVLCVPLKHRDAVLGVVYVDNRIQAGIFTPDDLDLLTALAANAAAAIENARLYQVAIEKGRMERELQIARQVQINLLPHSLPESAGWDFGAHWQPAREVAGDFYDFNWHADGSLSLVIADVTDKGMPAALYMALSRSIVRASLAQTGDLAEGINQVNRLICADNSYGMFVTLFYARLNPHTGELRYVNAGHNPPLLLHAGTGQLERLTRTGIALGVDDSRTYREQSVQMLPGDLILLYTDGLTEAPDPDGHEFGEDRLQAALLESAALPATQLGERLEQIVEAHLNGGAPQDDLTLVIVRRLQG